MKNLKTNYRQVFSVLTVTILCLFIFNKSQAQNKWELTFRPAVNFPTQDLGNTKLNTGFGAEAMVGYSIQKHLSAFVGWGWNRFSSKNLPSKLDYEETGYSFGLQFNHPIPQCKWNYLVGVSGIYNHIEVENSTGDLISDTGHGLGWQAEAGASYPFGKRFHFIPSIRYRALSREISIGNITTPVDLNYFSVNGAISWSF